MVGGLIGGKCCVGGAGHLGGGMAGGGIGPGWHAGMRVMVVLDRRYDGVRVDSEEVVSG